jgi:hypothetical protein
MVRTSKPRVADCTEIESNYNSAGAWPYIFQAGTGTIRANCPALVVKAGEALLACRNPNECTDQLFSAPS